MIAIPKAIKPQYKILAIDPGCRNDGGTGIAFMNNKSSIETFLVRPENKTNWDIKIEEVCYGYYRLLKDSISSGKISVNETIIGIEKPKYFDTYKGVTAAKSDNLFKLIVCYARLWQINVGMGFSIKNIEIVHWKGQLNKKQIAARVEKKTGKKFKGDAIDAVGIGLYMLGDWYKC